MSPKQRRKPKAKLKRRAKSTVPSEYTPRHAVSRISDDALVLGSWDPFETEDSPRIKGWKKEAPEGVDNDYARWIWKANFMASRHPTKLEEIRYCYQKAYLDSSNLAESFYHYSREIVGRDIPDNDGRMRFFAYMTNPKHNKMIQAARGSWKSSICVADYITWLIARDLFLNGESKLRILLASEVDNLATRNLRWARIIMTWRKEFHALAGDHRESKRGGANWGDSGIMSRFRRDPSVVENTVWAMGRDSEATGFHADYIICDDLQALRGSTTRDQIDKCHDFYRLLLSILDPKGYMSIVCTRWHYDDIYSRIEEENEDLDKDEQFAILKIPAVDPETKKLNFPDILSHKKLKALRRRQSTYIFSCQYMLDPVPDEERRFKPGYKQYIKPFQLTQPKLNKWVTADFAWTEVRRQDYSRQVTQDFTVIMTVAVDERWNYIVIDWFRQRCSKFAAITELYRQYNSHTAISVALQKFDRAQIADAIEQHGHERGQFLPIDWVTYPPTMSKMSRIETILEPLCRDLKLFIPDDHMSCGKMDWLFDDELLDFPKMRYADGADALCNVAHIAKPPSQTKIKSKFTKEQMEVRRLKSRNYHEIGKPSTWDNI
jgi:hypothetical protein